MYHTLLQVLRFDRADSGMECDVSWTLRTTLAGLLVTVLSWTAAPVCAQQSLFNVPSTALTQPEQIFFQEQFNFTNAGESNTTLEFGVGGGWELGMNVVNATFYSSGGINNESVLLNAQRVFDFEQTLYVEVGMLAGASVMPGQSSSQFSSFQWVTGRYHKTTGFKGEFIVGIYDGSEAYLGPNHAVGYMLGTEIPLIPDKLTFIADYISGATASSVAVIGLQFHVDPEAGWLISVGGSIPSPRSGNPYGVVVEFTRNPEPRPEEVASYLRRRVIPVSNRVPRRELRF